VISLTVKLEEPPPPPAGPVGPVAPVLPPPPPANRSVPTPVEHAVKSR